MEGTVYLYTYVLFRALNLRFFFSFLSPHSGTRIEWIIRVMRDYKVSLLRVKIKKERPYYIPLQRTPIFLSNTHSDIQSIGDGQSNRPTVRSELYFVNKSRIPHVVSNLG